MRILEEARITADKIKDLSRSAGQLPSASSIKRIESNFRRVHGLLSEERGLSDPKGILEQLKQPVAIWLQTGKVDKLDTPKNLRRICYFLENTDLVKPALLDSGKVNDLFVLMDRNWRDSYLTPLIITFLRHYKDEGSVRKSIDAVASLILRKLSKYQGSRAIPLMAHLLSDSIFVKRDPSEISRQVYSIGTDWFTACESAHILQQVQGTDYFGVALIEYALLVSNPEYLLDETQLERVSKLGLADIQKALLAVLIERCGASSNNESKLISYAFSRVGDPLTPSNWRCMASAFSPYNELLERGRVTISGWINREVVEYFFSKAAMDGGRKAFWARYAPKMSMIRIAMHTSWSFDIKHSGNSEVETWLKNRLVRVLSETNDICLIMEYGDWAIVEIGTHGNACYVYKRTNQVICELGSTIDNLKRLKKTILPALSPFNLKGEGRIIHVYGWQDTFRYILKNKIGLTA